MGTFMRRLLRTVLRSEEGATLVEYSLLLALIAMTCVTALTSASCSISAVFRRTAEVFGS